MLTIELAGRASAYPRSIGLIQDVGELLYLLDPAHDRAAFSQAQAALTRAQAGPAAAEAREQVVRVLNRIAGQAVADKAAPLARFEAGALAPSQAGTRS